jgi:hypothetical protein
MNKLPCGHLGGPGQGAAEHVSERTATCVSERAEAATRPWAVQGVAHV